MNNYRVNITRRSKKLVYYIRATTKIGAESTACKLASFPGWHQSFADSVNPVNNCNNFRMLQLTNP